MKIFENMKFPFFRKFEIWSYKFHLVLKMISGIILKFDVVFSKVRLFFTHILEISHGGLIASYGSPIASYGSRLASYGSPIASNCIVWQSHCIVWQSDCIVWQSNCIVWQSNCIVCGSSVHFCHWGSLDLISNFGAHDSWAIM